MPLFSANFVSAFRLLDGLTEALLYFAIVFGPWAFGTTQTWSIQIMNGVGLTLGGLWFLKKFLQSQAIKTSPQPESSAGARRFTWLLGAGTVLCLVYCLISALNARAIYHPTEWSFEYLPALNWLPHSYDRDRTWSAFWEFLGSAGLFWALRDWLLTDPTILRADPKKTRKPSSSTRLRRLFWLLALNGTALAFQGLIQRAEGGNALLWLVHPHFADKTSLFGPFAYRANASQYFNLLWPAVLGFWWTRSLSPSGKKIARLLLPCVVVMAICPLMTSSRGGTLIMAGNLILTAGILLLAQWRQVWWHKLAILIGFAAVVGTGILLAWPALAPRMEQLPTGYAGRESLYVTGQYMATDNPWLGTGPGTFESMYQLYRPPASAEWLAYMHNDWLETRITFGWLGALPVFFLLLLLPVHYLRVGGGAPGNLVFVLLLGVALGGCLVHAAFDFPFQIHSVLTLFLILGAVLSCLSRRTA